MVAHGCGVTLPRTESGNYISVLDECGGHTVPYHFHQSLSCLYDSSTAGSDGHSALVPIKKINHSA